MTKLLEKTTIKIVKEKDLAHEIQEKTKEAKELNLDLVVREITQREDDYFELIFDFNKKTNYGDIKVSDVHTVASIIEAIEESKEKRTYWLNIVNRYDEKEQLTEDEKNHLRMAEAHYSIFAGAVTGLEYAIGERSAI